MTQNMDTSAFMDADTFNKRMAAYDQTIKQQGEQIGCAPTRGPGRSLARRSCSTSWLFRPPRSQLQEMHALILKQLQELNHLVRSMALPGVCRRKGLSPDSRALLRVADLVETNSGQVEEPRGAHESPPGEEPA